MSLPVTARDVDRASAVLADVVRHTPLELSDRLSEEVGQPVYLKREDLQVCRSFKVRGAYTKMSGLTEAERAGGVVAASAGNHAQGVAYACARLNISGTIFLPASTPRQKRRRIATIGGTWVTQVIVAGNFDETNRVAQQHARDHGCVYVHPYDDADVIAGQGSVAVQLGQQMPEATDTVMIPVGGGGLISGMAVWLKEHRPGVRIVGVESEGAASMRQALSAGRPVSLERVNSFVDGTAVGCAGETTFALVRDIVDDIVVVPEGAVCTEMLDLYHSEGIIAEPAGALASAAARRYLPHIPNGPLVCVISGGNNDLSRYAEVLERSARHEGLRHYFLVRFNQEPGALRAFLNDVLIDGEDIVHFQYTKKNNRDTGPALVGIELPDPHEIRDLRRRLASSPLTVEEVSPDSAIFNLLV
ncbi:threonine ammonia-lyase IlvA [Nanchangia anserum]|uniref:L-threonine dehydratase n=1 Tax=Nanchangia anserum TaxID=2692125 RepID=A0A8I0GAW2_9ACTO|nr:threonine ammonia-lyase IlvA [Nanchangia anserum]MBD3688891.1 threonine ammonia-lyase IlvA [Nanchangia anserum]QOX81157.1 threonine ammonia-lyase IlvA [Nanchangia anserum]